MGESFGKSEADNYKATGVAEPFIGDAGKRFNELLFYAGLERKNVVLMNALRCYQPKNPTPIKKELDTCFIYTLLDIQRIRPKLVVAMGRPATYQVLGEDRPIETIRGKIYWSEKIKCNVFVTYHPAACLYDPNKWKLLVEDFRKIPKYLGLKVIRYKQAPYTVVKTPEQFRQLVPKLVDKLVSHDVETDDLNVYTNHYTLIQFALSEDEIYVLEPELIPQILPELKEVLAKMKTLGQAFTFDAKMNLEKIGSLIEHWTFDTCQAQFCLTGVKNNDLTYLVGEYCPEYFGYDAEVNALGGAHKLRDKKKLMDYGSNDVAVLFPIMKKQYKLMAKRDCLHLYENIMMPTIKILTKMSARGVMYDIPKVLEVDKEYAAKSQSALDAVLELESVKKCQERFNQPFNPRSYPMVAWLMLKYYDMPVLKMTKNKNNTSNPSIGKEEMQRYAEEYDNEYCEKMLKYRSIETVRNNFLSGALPKLVDGIAHTSYSLHSTAGGRPNSKNPNLLNVPRDKNVKRCLISRPGYQFVISDEAQLEVRVASVVYDEPKLIKISNDFSKDIHSAITAVAFGQEYDEVYNNYKKGDLYFTELRVKGKTIQFGVLYQMGPKKLAYQLKIPKEDATQFIADYYLRFDNLRKNIDLVKYLIQEQGYVDNYFNFRRAWPYDVLHNEDEGVVQEALRQGVNHQVQSVAWNLLELALIEIDKQLDKYHLDAYLVMQVYDSIIVEVADRHVNDVVKVVKEVMQNVNEPYENINRVRLKSDVEVGINQADLEKVA
ncbi:MAG: hypothetical protein KKD77_22420 [Gammaproteobacteria bacterium]|nr:hypothetical protein [Gammaproteobacteria bacterium]